MDSGPLGHLAAVARPAWNWPAATIHLTHSVQQEVVDAGYKKQDLLTRTTAGAPWCRVHDVPSDSQAARMFSEHLRPRQSNANRNVGEDETIALLATEARDGVFVLADRAATLTALAELGVGRVASPFCLYDDLAKRNLISAEDMQELCERTVRQMKQALPGMPWRMSQLWPQQR